MDSVSLSELIAATGGRPVGVTTSDARFRRVSIDSRTVRAGDVFWAVRGERHDGHNYVEHARNRGAALCVAQRPAPGGPALKVADTIQALGSFARWYRQQQDALVIAVTGSVGKTTTRNMIHAALAAHYPGVRSRQNFNNQFGLPLTLLQIQPEHEFAVVELGASRIGEIRELAEIAQPEIGVVTAVGAAHLSGFGSQARIVQGKGELLEQLPASGFAVLPGDDDRIRAMASRARCPVIFVGEGAGNDLRATDVLVSRNNLIFAVDGDWYRVAVSGRHHLSGALCAVAIGREIGLSPAVIADGLLDFVPPAGRCQVAEIGTWTVIDDTYNANPTSMRAACRLLDERDFRQAGPRLLVVGDMLELGQSAVAAHRELGAAAANARVDGLLAYGPHANEVVRGAITAGMDPHRIAGCIEFEPLLAVLDCWLESGAVVLVKGSRGMQMERVVGWLREEARREPVAPPPLERSCA